METKSSYLGRLKSKINRKKPIHKINSASANICGLAFFVGNCIAYKAKAFGRAYKNVREKYLTKNNPYANSLLHRD